jgi:hypothetical protein
MDKKTLKALHGSINKWIKIVRGTGEDHGENNCPLCQMFNTSSNDCVGCPVFEATGEPFCKDTPYMEWLQFDTDRAKTESQIQTARAELAFLQSLLPSNVLSSQGNK